MSSLAWIDFDEKERQRAQRILALLQERESRDELGLGAIRDSIADHLFPGTSTIQTRLRYMLFIPWLFQRLEGRGLSGSQLRAEGRDMEIQLAKALKVGGETTGIIGRNAGDSLRQLPSSIYWSGLASWKIRCFPGSVDALFTALADRKPMRGASDDEERGAGARSAAIWHAGLPCAPDDLLDQAVFRLTAEEAGFIIDRLRHSQKDALLTELAAGQETDVECEYIWAHPHLGLFSEPARRLVRHGEIFSSVMHGAALVYNLCLSELRQSEDWIADYRDRLVTWALDLDLDALRGWSLEGFWDAVAHTDHRIASAAMKFVTQWVELVVESNGRIADAPAARKLIENRERTLKGAQSRFKNIAVRDRWTGASGIERLSFRWPQARSHLKDLANAG